MEQRASALEILDMEVSEIEKRIVDILTTSETPLPKPRAERLKSYRLHQALAKKAKSIVGNPYKVIDEVHLREFVYLVNNLAIVVGEDREEKIDLFINFINIMGNKTIRYFAIYNSVSQCFETSPYARARISIQRFTGRVADAIFSPDGVLDQGDFIRFSVRCEEPNLREQNPEMLMARGNPFHFPYLVSIYLQNYLVIKSNDGSRIVEMYHPAQLQSSAAPFPPVSHL